MAVITLDDYAVSDQARLTFNWEGLVSASSDTGAPAAVGTATDLCVQCLGTFGASGTVTMQGSNDGGTTWATLHDHIGDDAVFAAAGIIQIAETPGLIRPLAGGTGGTALKVYVSAAAKGR